MINEVSHSLPQKCRTLCCICLRSCCFGLETRIIIKRRRSICSLCRYLVWKPPVLPLMAVRECLLLQNFMPDPLVVSKWFLAHCKRVIFTKNLLFDEFLKEIRRIFTLLLTFYQSFSSKQVLSDHFRPILSIPSDRAWIFWSVGTLRQPFGAKLEDLRRF